STSQLIVGGHGPSGGGPPPQRFLAARLQLPQARHFRPLLDETLQMPNRHIVAACALQRIHISQCHTLTARPAPGGGFTQPHGGVGIPPAQTDGNLQRGELRPRGSRSARLVKSLLSLPVITPFPG